MPKRQIALYLSEETIARLRPFVALRQANSLIEAAIIQKLDALEGQRTVVSYTLGNSTSSTVVVKKDGSE